MRTLIGIGYGPANLALAAALHELPQHWTLGDVEFLEKQERFGWHREMLLPETTMQISFLKDLVTVRNPRSEFSFVNYLAEKGRLSDFINMKTFFPTRIEFHDYLEWVAERVSAPVHYGETVHTVDIVGNPTGGYAYAIASTDHAGRERRRTSRHLAIGTGLVPRVPTKFPCDGRILHTSRFLSGTTGLDRSAALRFAVVGAGQSAAEIVDYLHSSFPRARVHVVHSRFGYSPADDSPFANRVFDPEAVDLFYDATDAEKARLLRYHANTNYSVVDADLIEQLYRRHYAELVDGQGRLLLHRSVEIMGVESGPDTVNLSVRDISGRTSALVVDRLVLATGYEPMEPHRLFTSPERFFELDKQGRFVVKRDYSVRTTLGPGELGEIYLQGDVERSHGITGSLLSNLATRSGRIVRSLLENEEPVVREESIHAEVGVD